ncbi:acyl-CoA thioesterase [Timonella senegalensis]|uniref:acyl-CoA thioesterase n=1 Tax=Timonella senegalensis TaxID=1465825 RepID=UPI00031EFCCF|nr:acyl-CoA thioesterase [Timonella senegalensis]
MTRFLDLARTTYLPRKPIDGFTVMDTSITVTRVRPTDIDIYLHVNNAVYLNMMDSARSNFLADCNGMKKLNKKGWYPVVAASSVKYKSSLLLGQKAEISTRVVGWDPRIAYLEQVIRHEGKVVTHAYIAARFLAKSGGKVSSQEILEFLGGPDESPELPADCLAWARATGVYFRENAK